MFKFKKGNIDILGSLFIQMIFAVVVIIGIIFAFMLWVGGHDYAVLTLYDAGVLSNQSAEIQAGFENTVESYESFDISGVADNVWFFSYMFMTIIGLFSAYRSRNTNFFTFLSMITFGMMFMLYIFGFFLVIMNWLYFDILLNLFINLIPNLPMMGWFIENGGIMFLVQGSVMLLVKVIDFDFASWTNRRKADTDNFDNEIM